jgi:hypothetical protein
MCDKNFFFRKFWQQRGSGAKPIVVKIYGKKSSYRTSPLLGLGTLIINTFPRISRCPRVRTFFSVNFGNSVGVALNLSWFSVRSQLPASS